MLLRRGFALEYVTLAWNVVGIVVLTIAVFATRSVALGGFGLDSLIEIGASTVVIWELSGSGEQRQRRALRLIGVAFVLLAAYLLVQSTIALATGHRPGQGMLGIVWTAVTAGVMFALAAAKSHTGRALGNPCSPPKDASPSWTGCSPPPSSSASPWILLSAGGGQTPSPATSSSTTPPAKPGPASPTEPADTANIG